MSMYSFYKKKIDSFEKERKMITLATIQSVARLEADAMDQAKGTDERFHSQVYGPKN